MKINPPLKYSVEEAISPLDGRNRPKVEMLALYFSDFALTKYRLLVEVAYFKKLAQIKIIRRLTPSEIKLLDNLTNNFDQKSYSSVKNLEKTTNHDMKAVEMFFQNKITATSLKDLVSMVHFCLTSDDINSLAYGLMVKGGLFQVIISELEKVQMFLKNNCREYKNFAMLGHTHGQPAVPTTVGKEFLVYHERLKTELNLLKKSVLKGKLTGNVGNFNAHFFVYPKIDWLKFSREFVKELGLEPDLATTQIEPYDSFLRVFSNLIRINNILLGLCIDLWDYISLGYFSQKVIDQEVGSTALPHKVNPINFEGAEGGFGIANALLEFYVRKLSYSRMQRDLSDSIVRRSFGTAFGYSLLSYKSLQEGLARIHPNKIRLHEDLHRHWEILSEAIQNFLRNQGYKQAYDQTKIFFRGKSCGPEEIKKFINSLKLKDQDKNKLLQLTPENYTGAAEKLIEQIL